MYGPTLRGARLRLEPPSHELIPLWLGWFADPQVNLYTLRFPPSQKMAEEWLEGAARSEKEVLWMIAVDERIIGSAQIDTINWHHRRAEIAIVLGEPAEWGKGYGTEAIQLITRFAFDELNLEKLVGEAIAANVGSIRAMGKAGYRQFGLAQRHFYQEGRWSDMWFGEALRGEWGQSAPSPE